MSTTAIKDSLTALDDMLHDFFVEHDGNDKLTDNLRALVETAQRNISTAKFALYRQAVNDAMAKQPLDIEEISKKLSVQERWMIRHVGMRDNCDATLLGVHAARMTELGLISSEDGTARLTELGAILNDLWKTRR